MKFVFVVTYYLSKVVEEETYSPHLCYLAMDPFQRELKNYKPSN